MGADTAIEWADHTFNPWWGCQKVSPACDSCYAERNAKRFSAGTVLWGVGSERRTFGDAHWAAPLKWARRAFVACPACGWRGMHTALRHESGVHLCPSCSNDEWRPARMRVFCASMADWLDLEAPLDEFVRLLDTIRRVPELDWLLLSKRIGNWRKRLEEARAHAADTEGSDMPLPRWIDAWLSGDVPSHCWLGATVVNQEEADRDIPKLLATPARVRFLSVEPMLGPVYVADIPDPAGGVCLKPLAGLRWVGNGQGRCETRSAGGRIDWVICGGESGPGARPMHPDWARNLRNQCQTAGVPFFFKQWGEWLQCWTEHDTDRRSGRTVEPVDPEIQLEREGPYRVIEAHGAEFVHVGKKVAGRQLDGRTWDEFPVARAAC